MKLNKLCSLPVFCLCLLLPHPTLASDACLRTLGSDSEYIAGLPHADTWFGSKDIAVILPENGVWPTTAPGHSLSVKLFWFIDGFKPGEEDEFKGRIKRIDKGEMDAVMLEPTNAGGVNLGSWTVLTGIDFPSAGCWEVSGEFRARSLTFVVETVPSTEWGTKRLATTRLLKVALTLPSLR